MSETASYRVSADGEDVIRMNERILSQQDRLISKVTELNKEVRKSREHSEGFASDLEKSASSAIGLLTGVTSVAAVTSAIAGSVARIKANLEESANAGAKLGNEMIAVAMLAEKGNKAETVRKALDYTGYKMTSGEALSAYNLALSTTGGDEKKTAEMMKYVRSGLMSGMDATTTINAIKLGTGAAQKLSPAESITLPYLAGKESKATPADLVKAAESMKFFDDKYLGWAVATQLTGSVGVDRLREASMAAGRALSRPATGEFNLYKKLHVDKASQFDRLLALERGGYNTTEKLVKAGFSELEVDALKSLIGDIPGLKQYYSNIKGGYKDNLIMEERGMSESELIKGGLPQMTYARKLEEAKNKSELSLATSPYVEEGALRKIIKQRQYSELISRGYGPYVSQESADAQEMKAGAFGYFHGVEGAPGLTRGFGKGVFVPSQLVPEYKPTQGALSDWSNDILTLGLLGRTKLDEMVGIMRQVAENTKKEFNDINKNAQKDAPQRFE